MLWLHVKYKYFEIISKLFQHYLDDDENVGKYSRAAVSL